MATGSALSSALEKISKDHLECSICQEKFTEPKLLECVHSFCEKCLQKYYNSKHKDAKKLPCPLCRRETVLPETGIRGLKTNFQLVALVEEVSQQERMAVSASAPKVCEICDVGSKATHRCLICLQNICASCSKTHLQSSSHKVANSGDDCSGNQPSEQASETDEVKCQRHGKMKKIFCETCNELICQACADADHAKPQHHCIDSEEASRKFRQSMQDKLSDFSREIESLEKFLGDTLQVKLELRNKIAETIKKVQDKAAKIASEVRAEENRLIEDIKNVEQDRNKILDQHEMEVSVMLQSKQDVLQKARELTDAASNTDLLMNYSAISKELEQLKTQNPLAIKRKLLFLCFKQSEAADAIRLGELVVESKWELCWEFGRQGSGAGEFRGAQGIAAWETGEIAVADLLNNRVVIHSTDGKFKEAFAMQGYPRDIVALPDVFVVVDGSNLVRIFEKNGKLAKEFPTVPQNDVNRIKVNLVSVAVTKDGTVIVGDIKRKVLTEHNPTDGSLIRTIPVQTPPWYLAVPADTDDRLVICGHAQVDVTDRRGDTIFTIKPTIRGHQVKFCTGVCCDSFGIYVALRKDDDGNGHIHHYDLEGKYIDCFAGGLHRPASVTFTADRQLAVADYYTVKMYRRV